ncbi:ATP-binding protein [Azospirillum sp. TSO5]|uniref:ATP-binding protein n=1 Tax=Azospirillum sp. TSO5 TaxID=716760 RepID=UPI001304A398|nr:ATP-binding protein [Azospirillum sp. TSO5]
MSILTVRQTLAPLRLLSRMAHAIGPGTTAMRLPLGGVPREVAPLVSAMNDVLDRLEDGFRLQREFTADAAHELRTPLAVLAAHIDTLSERSAAKGFWRAERRGSGSGLGLAIVQRTMTAHGGTVIVEDAVDGGACFQLVFPDPLQTAPMAAGGAPHVRS